MESSGPLVMVVLLCPSLLCDSSSELQKAQDLLAKGSLSEAVTILRRWLKIIRTIWMPLSRLGLR